MAFGWCLRLEFANPFPYVHVLERVFLVCFFFQRRFGPGHFDLDSARRGYPSL